MDKKLAILALGAVALIVLLVSESATSSLTIATETGEVEVQVELAETSAEMTKGLMHREFLDENSGMLFIFDDSKARTLWMKNTIIPLDMIFISEENRIIDIQTATPCTADPCKKYTSREPAMYVLEVNAGFADKNGIKLSNTILLKNS